jgi:hypothetical protein
LDGVSKNNGQEHIRAVDQSPSTDHASGAGAKTRGGDHPCRRGRAGRHR